MPADVRRKLKEDGGEKKLSRTRRAKKRGRKKKSRIEDERVLTFAKGGQ